MCRMSLLVSDYTYNTSVGFLKTNKQQKQQQKNANKDSVYVLQQQTLTLFCDYKTPAADTESLYTLDPPKNGNKKRKHKNKKKHK